MVPKKYAGVSKLGYEFFVDSKDRNENGHGYVDMFEGTVYNSNISIPLKDTDSCKGLRLYFKEYTPPQYTRGLCIWIEDVLFVE